MTTTCPHRIPELPSIRCELIRDHKEEFHLKALDGGELVFTWKLTSPKIRNRRKIVVPQVPPTPITITREIGEEELMGYGALYGFF